jgi:N-acetylglucosamine-6-phosphate deacetylase
MEQVLAATTVATGTQVLSPGAVTVENGRILAVSDVVPDGAPVRAHRRHGTTTIGASLVSAHPEALLRDVSALAELVEDGLIAGTHLEGPWIAPQMKGAHDPTTLRPPSPDEVDAVLAAARGTVHMVTLAPELEHGMDAVRRIAAAGALPAIGHTDADWETTRAAIDAGGSVATHLFNQMRPIHHRRPGPIPALMADPRMHVELIADGIHLHPAVIAMVRHAVPVDRIVLVTDAMAAAGQADGEYMLGDLAVTVSDGVARLVEGGALAGSTLTMDKAFRLVVQHGGFSVADAVLASAVTPARLMARDDIGAIAVGKSADLVALDPDLRLHRVWHQGEIVTG